MKTFYQNNLGLVQLGLHFGHCISFSGVLGENTNTLLASLLAGGEKKIQISNSEFYPLV